MFWIYSGSPFHGYGWNQELSLGNMSPFPGTICLFSLKVMHRNGKLDELKMNEQERNGRSNLLKKNYTNENWSNLREKSKKGFFFKVNCKGWIRNFFLSSNLSSIFKIDFIVFFAEPQNKQLSHKGWHRNCCSKLELPRPCLLLRRLGRKALWKDGRNVKTFPYDISWKRSQTAWKKGVSIFFRCQSKESTKLSGVP